MRAGRFRDRTCELFLSSEQVEYSRYWLKEMGKTGGQLLPLPHSSYLYTVPKDLESVTKIQIPKDEVKNTSKLFDFHKVWHWAAVIFASLTLHILLTGSHQTERPVDR
jgi:hypothetical protein